MATNMQKIRNIIQSFPEPLNVYLLNRIDKSTRTDLEYYSRTVAKYLENEYVYGFARSRKRSAQCTVSRGDYLDAIAKLFGFHYTYELSKYRREAASLVSQYFDIFKQSKGNKDFDGSRASYDTRNSQLKGSKKYSPKGGQVSSLTDMIIDLIQNKPKETGFHSLKENKYVILNIMSILRGNRLAHSTPPSKILHCIRKVDFMEATMKSLDFNVNDKENVKKSIAEIFNLLKSLISLKNSKESRELLHQLNTGENGLFSLCTLAKNKTGSWSFFKNRQEFLNLYKCLNIFLKENTKSCNAITRLTRLQKGIGGEFYRLSGNEYYRDLFNYYFLREFKSFKISDTSVLHRGNEDYEKKMITKKMATELGGILNSNEKFSLYNECIENLQKQVQKNILPNYVILANELIKKINSKCVFVENTGEQLKL